MPAGFIGAGQMGRPMVDRLDAAIGELSIYIFPGRPRARRGLADRLLEQPLVLVCGE